LRFLPPEPEDLPADEALDEAELRLAAELLADDPLAE
jgi:hypothetical protein